jgi:hypothetical protein
MGPKLEARVPLDIVLIICTRIPRSPVPLERTLVAREVPRYYVLHPVHLIIRVVFSFICTEVLASRREIPTTLEVWIHGLTISKFIIATCSIARRSL